MKPSAFWPWWLIHLVLFFLAITFFVFNLTALQVLAMAAQMYAFGRYSQLHAMGIRNIESVRDEP